MGNEDATPATPGSLERWIAGALPSASAPAAGEVLDDFELVRFVASGGMGEVWEARQRSLGGRRVALKLMRAEGDERGLLAFEREARAGGRLSHPGLVGVLARGASEGRPWIAMELVEGGRTLKDWLHERKGLAALPPGHDREVAELVAGIADAVGALHDAGVIHRDLKPANVLLTPEGRPKVSDFGIARLVDETALTRTDEAPGTCAYMSPEQVAARRSEVGPRSDVFSLGVVLYELLALRRPFEGDTAAQVTRRIEREEPRPLRSIRSRVPRDLEVICGRALEKEPRARFASMAELAAELRRFLRDEPIRSAPPGAARRAWKWVHRHPARSGIGAVATVAFTAISLLLAENVRANRDLEERTREAEARRDEVLELSALQDLDELVEEADELWPPHPELVDRYENWIEDARELVSRLPGFRARREEIRARALPWTQVERLAEREAHERFGDLVVLDGRIEALRHALAMRRDGVEAELPELEGADYPEDAWGLDVMACGLASPDRAEFGRELLGLALAREAVERSPDWYRPTALSNYARACFVLGRDDDALNAAFAALDEATRPERIEEHRERLERMESDVAEAGSPEGIRAAEEQLARLEAERDELERLVDERRTWTFEPEDSELRWWELQLGRLIDGVEALLDDGTGLLAERAVTPEHGWSVPRRLRAARELATGFAPGGELLRRWEAAVDELRKAYPELDVAPRVGLVPIGRDPRSGLFEFWHVLSGAEPRRDEAGRLRIEEETGIVLVLLPGGRATIGASPVAGEPHHDPLAQRDEQPPRPVLLSPYLIGKYEVTQAQYERVMGVNPSAFSPSVQRNSVTMDLTHPVEQVNWFDASDFVSRLGLDLPTEAQWEVACRAGSSSVYSHGDDVAGLQPYANLGDEANLAFWTSSMQYEPGYSDPYAAHGPVGAMEPNAFGLHDPHGNVWEWAADGYEYYAYRKLGYRDPLIEPAGRVDRSLRGSAFNGPAELARSTYRLNQPPTFTSYAVGLRAARRW